MTLIDQKTNHSAQANTRWLHQFCNADDLKLLLKSYVDQVQILENAAFELLLERSLPDAVGEQLTQLGKIVGADRQTSNDTEFKVVIQARQALNNSRGTPEDIINAAVLMFTNAAQEVFIIKEEPPAQLRVTLIDVPSIDPYLIQRLLDAADVAGNRLLVSWSTSATAARFAFSDVVSGGGGNGGYSDVSGAYTGAELVSVTDG